MPSIRLSLDLEEIYPRGANCGHCASLLAAPLPCCTWVTESATVLTIKGASPDPHPAVLSNDNIIRRLNGGRVSITESKSLTMPRLNILGYPWYGIKFHADTPFVVPQQHCLFSQRTIFELEWEDHSNLKPAIRALVAIDTQRHSHLRMTRLSGVVRQIQSLASCFMQMLARGPPRLLTGNLA